MGYRRKMHTASLCKSIMFSIQWFQIHHITFSTIYNKVVGLSGARVSPFHGLVPQLYGTEIKLITRIMQNTYHYLTTFVPKMRSITGTVSFTESTVYSESIGCKVTLPS